MTPLAGWTPVHVSWSTGAPVVEWRDLRGLAFDAPTLDHVTELAFREPYRLLFAARTPIEELGAVAAAAPAIAPSGFIFHASRCGSTLVSNMLGALDDTIVASEPPVLDGIFRADLHAGTDDETRSRWLESAIHALGQPRRGGERRFFIKLDSWSTRDMGLVRALYPDVPCVFVYRDPAEIITSHMRVRGAHMIPGLLQSELFGVDDATVVAPDEYCARVVASIFDAAHDQLAPGCRLVNYQELPALVTDEILALFGVRPTADELARVRAVAGLDAKNPVLAFDPSQPGRVWPVTTAIRAATDRWAGAAYARLEAARASALVST